MKKSEPIIPQNDRATEPFEEVGMRILETLIADYQKAQAAWATKLEEDDRDENTRQEWRVLMDTAWAVVGYRCADLREIDRKASFISLDESLVDMLASCQTHEAVQFFLASMISPVEKSNSGEN